MSNTEVNEQFFSLNLPGSWKTVGTDKQDLWIYEFEGARQRLSVSVLVFEEKITDAGIREMFNQFSAARREADLEGEDGTALTETDVSELEGAVTGIYAGEDGTGRRLANFIIVNGAGVANFCLEAFEIEAEPFIERAWEVLGSVGFVEPE